MGRFVVRDLKDLNKWQKRVSLAFRLHPTISLLAGIILSCFEPLPIFQHANESAINSITHFLP